MESRRTRDSGDGVTGCMMEVFQFGDIDNAYEMKPSK